MKIVRLITIILVFLGVSSAEENNAHLSLKLEVKRAIKLGSKYLASEREKDGSWSDDEHPAISALVLTALSRDPNAIKALNEEELEKSYAWILGHQQEDGGIYTEGLATYNTSTAIMALLASGDAEYHPAILRARAFLVGQQTDWGEQGESDTPYDGGIGYGGTYKHSDLSNTHLALEAIYHTKNIALDELVEEQPQLDWEGALEFVNRCQNLRLSNDQDWASDDPDNKGGFVYFPGSSKAGEAELKGGATALRSYGSMSYAGLLSLVFADLDAMDPRVTSVVEWVSNHFSVEENPGMGQQGVFYYYQAMAKALSASGLRSLETSDGVMVDWRSKLGGKLVALQEGDGSWKNGTGRWWENDPILVTAYAVLALEQLYSTM